MNNNLRRKEERLQRELEDISVDDNTHRLETLTSDLQSVETRSNGNRSRVKGDDIWCLGCRLVTDA